MPRAPLAIIFLAGACAFAQSQAAVPPATANAAVITDPAQIRSQSNFNVQALTIEKLYMTRSIKSSAWSPDGTKIAFISNISGRDNLWIVPAEGGWPVQLTLSNQRQVLPAWSPNGRWIAYMSDIDGNEQWDIFLVSPIDGQVLNLTNTAEISEESPAWSPDGGKLAYSVKPKDSPNYEIDVMEIATRKVTHLTTGTPKERSNFSPIWSHDGRGIVFTEQNAAEKDSNVLSADLLTGRATNLTPHPGEHNFIASDISPDGKTVLLTSNAGNGYDNAALLDVATKKITWLTRDKWEVRAGKFSPDGKRATWMVNVDGNQDIVVAEPGASRRVTLPLAKGINTLAGADTPFTGDGARLLYRHDGPTTPGDLWVFDFNTGKSRQLTNALVGGMRSNDMAEPYLVHYPSQDGKWQISAFVYAPYNAERNGKNAAVVYIHGGPNAQTLNSFSRIIQYLANQGFFVIAPNYRGSSGYGKDFEDANRFDMGGGDLEDIKAAADWMVKTGYVDANKIAVTGASYGGYLTMMALSKAPERWAAGAATVPVVNWFTEIEHQDPLLREYFIATLGDPMKDKARLRDRSPIYFVDQIKAPVLLLAGSNDPRCPPSEAEQVAAALNKRGRVVELKVYEKEGHGFAKIENQMDAITRIADFLKKYDPPEKCGCNLNDQ
jgi:dipeptidyl aminopeptidase/acylaminoacyl peptidase